MQGIAEEANNQPESATEEVDEKAEQAAPKLAPAIHLLSKATDEVGRPVQRTVDESGNIVEAALDESGELIDEDIVGNVNDLPSEEEYMNEEGETVRTVKEETGPSFI